jgi:hypothetical protein
VEILGQVYEQFLGKVIRRKAGGQVRVEDKPEVKKAGGVYYTPRYIVDYIVSHTLGKQLEGKTAKQAEKLKILDPACGSGSFLLGAYQYLLDWHRDYYVQLANGDGAQSKIKGLKSRIYQAMGGWRLTTTEKKRILLNSIYGVDIDPQAVEVTKLSLLLKVLEGESKETLERQLHLWHERALPDLASNIKCGNSLIGPDFYEGQQMTMFGEEERYRINVFNWKDAFPQITKAGGFDVVIGNPPWLMAGYYVTDSMEYLRRKFSSAQGKFDLYYVFIEQSCRLLSADGVFGMIVPNKMFHTKAATTLRRMLADARSIRCIVDFGDEHIFSGATNYSCLLFLQRKAGPNPRYASAKAGLSIIREFRVPWSVFAAQTWTFEDQTTRRLFKKLETIGIPLERLTARFGTGVQSGADTLLMLNPQEAKTRGLESEILRAIYRGRDVRRYAVSARPKMLIFPYEVADGSFQILSEPRLEKFRKAYTMLHASKAKLAQRIWFGKSARELSGKWYGMMYLDDYSSFAAPHLLTPSLSNQSNFALGTGTLFATGTAGVTSIIPRDGLEEDIRYLLGLLNSRLLSVYAIRHSPVFSGAYYKFSAPYLKKLPIKRPDFSSRVEKARHDRIVELVDEMLALHKQSARVKTPHDKSVFQNQIDATDRQIDRLVYELYGLTDEEIKIVEGANQT